MASWLSIPEYVEKYAPQVGVSKSYLSNLVEGRKIRNLQVMKRRKGRRGRGVARQDGYTWPSRKTVAVWDEPPEMPGKSHGCPKRFCVKCGRRETRNRPFSLGGVCARCVREAEHYSKRHPLVGSVASAEAYNEIREEAVGQRMTEMADQRMRQDRLKRIEYHARRIEQLGLCGNGVDWV